MAAVRRMVSYPLSVSATLAARVELDTGAQIAVLRSAIVGKTEEEIEAAIYAYLGEVIYVHWNDDGSLAIAWGDEPDVWPEDVIDG